MDITRLRLYRQHLSNPTLKSPRDVVQWFGAVQAQDFAAAKWALGLRLANAADQDVEEAFNRGEILRTHVLRPTWHFVLPENIRWMLELTAPRVKAVLAPYDRRLEITPALLAKCEGIFARALAGGNYLTRAELEQSLKRAKILVHGQRLGHIVANAELDQVMCSGPRRGKQFTYASLGERAPRPKKMSRDEAVARLALSYFTSHGPAQAKDFSWWSGLSGRDAAGGLEAIGSKLDQETMNGKTYWFAPGSLARVPGAPPALLLSLFDEYLIAYRDRGDLGGQEDIASMLSRGAAVTAVVVIAGKVAGTWKRSVGKRGVEIRVRPFKLLDKRLRDPIGREATRYGEFLGLEAEWAEVKK